MLLTHDEIPPDLAEFFEPAGCGRCYVCRIVDVFREVRRVLAAHGTVWCNLGDSYAAARSYQVRDNKHADVGNTMAASVPEGLKQKDLVGVPWRVAFALQADGWWLRADIIWEKPNAMPESIVDRPTKSHEHVFLLTKQPRYYYDRIAVREPHAGRQSGNIARKYGADVGAPSARPGDLGRSIPWSPPPDRPQDEYLGQDLGWPAPDGAPRGADGRRVTKVRAREGSAQHRDGERWPDPDGRNMRDVWSIPTESYSESHFAVFPRELVRRALLAGCPERVCLTCGEPSERIVESNNPSKHAADDNTLGWANTHTKTSNAQSSKSLHRNPGGVYSSAVVLGWSDCGHENYRVGVVLDPFAGSGTTLLVARNHGRHAIGIDLNASYCELARRRLQQLSLLT